MHRFLPHIVVLATGITGCYSCGSSQGQSEEDKDLRVPTPVWHQPSSPTPTSTEEPGVTPTPSPTDTPVLQPCTESKMWLCHIPYSVLDQNDNPCQSENCPEAQAIWLCLPPPGIEHHLEHHTSDYLRGMIVDPPHCEEEE